MNRILLALAAVSLILGLAACEDKTKERARELVFDNKSRYTVDVIPRTIEIDRFSLPSGERVKFKNIKNPDFRYEPMTKVQEGMESKERYVVFVDKPPEPKPK